MASSNLVSVLSAAIVLGLLSSVPDVTTATESGWGVPELIETYDAGSAHSPKIAVDGKGNAMAVWYQYYTEATLPSIYAGRYVAGAGWEPPQLVENSYQNTFEPDVGMDSQGNAIVVWTEWDDTRWNLWSNRYVAEVGWGEPQLIETNDLGSVAKPDIAMDAAGNAVVVWQQFDGVQYHIWSNRYVAGVGWMTAQQIDQDYTGDCFEPKVGIDDSGNAIVVWRLSDGLHYHIWSNRYVVGSGWGTSQPIEANISESATYPRVAVDRSGNAIAVWMLYLGHHTIWANRYTVGAGWGTAQLIQIDDSEEALYPRVAVDGSGNAVAVWEQYDGVLKNVWSNRYVVGSGWETAQLIENENSYHAFNGQVAMDEAGNAIATWSQSDGSRPNIWASRYVVGSGWENPQLIEFDNSGMAGQTELGMDSSGGAIAVWWQEDAYTTSIWANRYVVPDVTPPELSLSSPADGLTTGTPVVTVSGTTEPGVALNVGGTVVAVESNGSFSCEIALVEGLNALVITATDAAGNTATTLRNVTYVDPVPGLQDELNAAMDDLAAAQDELDSLQDDLGAMQEELDSTKDQLSSAEDDLEDLRTQNLILSAALAVFAALVVLVSIMYFGIRRKMTDASPAKVDKEPPPPES